MYADFFVKLEESIQNEDFRLKHKLAQFCNQLTVSIDQVQEMGLRTATGESFEHYERFFIQAYLQSICNFKLGKV